MRIGVTLPQMGEEAGPESIRVVAEAAEALGFAGVWVGDHIVLPKDHVSDYPFSTSGEFPFPGAVPWLEAFTCLSYVAALTERVQLGISVCVVPYRPAALLAKVVASLDRLSDGRVVLGVGAGWLEREFEALNASFADRGRVTDETLALLVEAWSHDGPVSQHGLHVNVDECYFSPRPNQGGELPIWVGGSGRAARRRTLQFGAAWHPHILAHSPEDIGAELEVLRESASVIGRSAPSAVLYAPIEVDGQSEGPPWRTGVIAGGANEIVDVLADYAAAGVSEFVVTMRGPAARDARVKADHMARLAQSW